MYACTVNVTLRRVERRRGSTRVVKWMKVGKLLTWEIIRNEWSSRSLRFDELGVPEYLTFEKAGKWF